MNFPLKIGQEVGNLSITANNKLIFFSKLYNMLGVKNAKTKLLSEGIVLGLAANEN
ncbi:MAG: hypothetical protein IJA76_07000 [Clostridia bacterium]|nr:hypothetical protein [Clostridia bacterium]MBQ4586780.1 hypothetical protein [Clostridia bacterium]